MSVLQQNLFLITLEAQFRDLFQASKAGKDNSEQRLRAQGFIHAGELLQLCSRQQVQLATVIAFGALARQVEQPQGQPGTALAMLLQVGANAADQIGAKQKQALITQHHAAPCGNQPHPKEQPAHTPGRQAD